MLLNHTDPGQSINNVYELPNIEQSIKYLHACAGFPKNSEWLEATRLGNYTKWTGLTIKYANKY